MKPTSEGTASTARVIVADDEAIIRMGLRRMLEDAGYQIIGEASTADEVFDLAEGRTADAVLLDIRMPGMDTLQAARVLARDYALPVVFVSAFSDPALVAQATEAGAVPDRGDTGRVEPLLRAPALGQ